jgi:hypothetical protein
VNSRFPQPPHAAASARYFFSIMQQPSMQPSSQPTIFQGLTRSLFTFTGAVQTFKAPAGKEWMYIVTKGAQGGNTGGLGGCISAKFSIIPGETLYVYVGGAGYLFNGAGGGDYYGGGASDVRRGGSAVGNRIIAAGGGGGGSGGGSGGLGGPDGAAGGGSAGSSGTRAWNGNCGGGGASVSAGGDCNSGSLLNGGGGTWVSADEFALRDGSSSA